MMASNDEPGAVSGLGNQPKLRRGLTLPLLTLYGLGVTIGAGIYVLVGATAAKAGIYAPISFLLAAVVVGFTGFSYCELGTRYPVSAGEAAYVRAGFNSRTLSLIVGLMVVASGVVSAAAVAIGAAAYLQAFVPLSPQLLTGMVILLVGLVAVWGITESVALAGLFTVIEVGGLGLVVYFGLQSRPEVLADFATEFGMLMPPFEVGAWSGILAAGLLAFFAFVGFEDMANVAEEVKEPGKTLPRGIILTLIMATMIYFIVVSVVVLVVPMSSLVGSAAPLALIFESAGPMTSAMFNIVAIIATVNGALIQVIMASRVLYGLAAQGNLPQIFANVNGLTRTPLPATALVVGIILFLAYFLPIAELAKTTSTIVLIVFAFVNLALLRLKCLGPEPSADVFRVPVWVPVLGFASSCCLLLAGVLFV
ncbi:MAG: APC family permease [Proteobacteria bacterium]|nr:APC family permease [Pseudomonadota bacterium]